LLIRPLLLPILLLLCPLPRRQRSRRYNRLPRWLNRQPALPAPIDKKAYVLYNTSGAGAPIQGGTMMSFDVFLNFDGNCRAALKFYAKVFKQKMPDNIMTYGQNPDGTAEVKKDRILYASIPIAGSNVMFADCPSAFKSVKGNNIMLTVGSQDEYEIKRIFAALADGGKIEMPLVKTFFSELFGMVTDRFGIMWQISKSPVNSD
jgi:PhnB protein